MRETDKTGNLYVGRKQVSYSKRGKRKGLLISKPPNGSTQMLTKLKATVTNIIIRKRKMSGYFQFWVFCKVIVRKNVAKKINSFFNK